MDSKYWGLVIQTNEYSSNFDRELCAYCTGHIGDCKVGEDYINTDEELINLFGETVIKQIPNFMGRKRPTSVWLNEHNRPKDVIIYFNEMPTEQQINKIKERTKTFSPIYVAKKGYNKHHYIYFVNFKVLEFFELEQDSAEKEPVEVKF